jgi:hypothetical protein
MPRPRLWVLLDAPAEVLQARKQEVTAAESARQRQAYLAFVRQQQEYAIVDAAQPLDEVIAEVERAVTAIDGASRQAYGEAMRVLLSAYACEPNRGSEPEVGWQRALHMVAHADEVWVLTRANNQAVIEADLLEPCSRIAFHLLRPSPVGF